MNPEKIFCVAACCRSQGFTGGVEYFGYLLSKALGCQCITTPQIKDVILEDNSSKYLFIVDGSHGELVPDHIPVVSVAHGTWVGFWARHKWEPEELSFENPPFEPSQMKMFGVSSRNIPPKPNTLVVAVSSGVKRELKMYHGLNKDTLVLLHGVEANIFVPRRDRNTRRERPVVLYTSQHSEYKGSHIIEKLKAWMPQFHFQSLQIQIDREHTAFQEVDMAIHLSCSEGNSFFCLEAMSCDLPMVVTNVGLFESDVDSSIVGKVLPYTSDISAFKNAIFEVWEGRQKFHPREWILQNATFEHFKSRWQSLVSNLEQFGLKGG
jgi:glycosyltransferase involved in cell wall biosynthesis